MQLVREILIPGTELGFLTLLVASLSLIVAFHNIFGLSYDSLLTEIVTRWSEVLIWLTTPIQYLAQTYVFPVFQNLLQLDLKVNACWRYVFVILGLYFTSSAWPALKGKHYATCAFLFLLGFVASFGASIFSALDSSNNSIRGVYGVTFTVLSIFVFEIAVSIWYATFHRNRVVRAFHLSGKQESWLDYVKADFVAQLIIALLVFSSFVVVVFWSPLSHEQAIQSIVPLCAILVYLAIYCVATAVNLQRRGNLHAHTLMEVRAVRLSATATRTLVWSIFVMSLSLLKDKLDLPF